MRAVFFGSPQFAVAVLRHLLQAGVEVPAVVCQPDKPAGRGNALLAPAVKVFAQQHGITVHQPLKVRDGQLAQWLRSMDIDIAVVAAYGRILTQEVLSTPPLGCVNIHASLLPRWRGASPIARAVAAGDATTGVCLMQMDAGLDTGPVLARAQLPIEADDTTPTLEIKLAELGGALVVANLGALVARSLTPTAQSGEGITYAPPLNRHDGLLDFARSATELHAQVRGLQPWPAAHFGASGDEQWKVAAEGLAVAAGSAPSGQVAKIDREHVWLGCGSGLLGVAWLQRPNRARAAAPDVLRGVRLAVGAQLVVRQDASSMP